MPAAGADPGRRTPWWGHRMLPAKLAIGPVVLYSLLSLAGPLADRRFGLVLLLVARIALGLATLVLVWGRRRAPHVVAAGYLLLVLVTGVLDRAYDVLLVLLSGLALVLSVGALVLGWLERRGAGRR